MTVPARRHLLRAACPLLLAAACVTLSATPAAAQALLWSLPEDGTEVLYQGTLTQTDSRPDGGTTQMSWDTSLAVRSVGGRDVEYQGQTVPGRWIEFESLVGQVSEGRIDPGPLGPRVYKVLVPESAVTGAAADARGLPIAFLPVVEGFEKLGDADPTPLAAGVFRPYPTLSLLMNFKPDEIKRAGGPESVTVPAGEYDAEGYTASATLESPAGRTEATATLSVAPGMPFGLVKWTAAAVRSAKDPNQPRDAFREVNRVEQQMEARAIRRDAKSVLSVP